MCFRCMCSQYVQWPVCVRARAGVFVIEEKRFKKKQNNNNGGDANVLWKLGEQV